MLRQLELSGFKSIKQATIDLKPINVLIGANGAGKSNLVSFFEMFQHMLRMQLELYLRKQGYANNLLHYGLKTTSEMSSLLNIETKSGKLDLDIRLISSLDGMLTFSKAKTTFKAGELGIGISYDYSPSNEVDFYNAFYAWDEEGALESQKTDDETVNAFIDSLKAQVNQENVDEFTLLSCETHSFLENTAVYHFHDTSLQSRLRQPTEISFNRFLANDGGNLASVLYKLKIAKPPYYQRILKVIQQIAPFFNDFVLEPEQDNTEYIKLRWRSQHSDIEFGAHQLSDGTLRAMALITVLLQPEEKLSGLIVIDEPELGLHPYALSTIIGLAKAATDYGSQVILATQSTTLLDHFEPEDIIVVEQNDGESSFKRLNSEELKDWLEDYSLSELWEKNVLGGIPS